MAGQGVMAVAAFVVAWMVYVQWEIGTVKPGEEQLVASDAGIVLGAALRDGKPSPALKERLDRALEAYEQGAFEHIIVSGGFDYPGAPKTEAQGMREYLVEQGVPEQRIIEEHYATSTYENLLYSQAIMKAHGWRTATIVTHTYHGARALDIAEFLSFEKPELAVVDSRVMNMAFHRTRETLAYSKWSMDKLLMGLGLQEQTVPVWDPQSNPKEEG